MVDTSAPRRRRVRRRWIWMAVVLALAAAVAVAVLRPRPPTPQRVYLESVQRTVFVRQVSGTGEVKAARSRVLVFPSNGTVAEVNVRDGDRVAAGAVLARLDTRALERTLASDRAALASARADLERVRAQQPIDRLDAEAAAAAADHRLADARQTLDDARSQLAATQRLYAAGGAARNELDDAAAAVERAERQVRDAGLARDAARARLDGFDALAAAQLASGAANVRRLETAVANEEQQRADASLVAPWAGVVAQVPLEVGDLALAATPVGITLVDDTTVSVVADFEENRALDLAPDQTATITPDAAPEVALPAVVTRVESVADRSASGSATLRAELAFAPAEPAALPREAVRPGYTVTARVVVRRIPDALVVPLEAIQSGSEGGWIYRVRQEAPGRGVAQRVAVEVVDRNDTLAAVRSQELRAGDRVAATNVDALRDGEPVAFEAEGGG